MAASDSLTPIEAAFYWLEHTTLSQWVNGLAFPTILSAHTLGMGFLAGTSIGIDLRLLGAAQRVPLAALDRFYPVIWIALAVNFASGILLLIGYPYKAFTNPVFYLKIALIVIAVYLIVLIRQTVLNSTNLGQPDALRRGKLLALSSLGCWIGVIAAGRLLAYTYSWLSVGIPNNL